MLAKTASFRRGPCKRRRLRKRKPREKTKSVKTMSGKRQTISRRASVACAGLLGRRRFFHVRSNFTVCWAAPTISTPAPIVSSPLPARCRPKAHYCYTFRCRPRERFHPKAHLFPKVYSHPTTHSIPTVRSRPTTRSFRKPCCWLPPPRPRCPLQIVNFPTPRCSSTRTMCSTPTKDHPPSARLHWPQKSPPETLPSCSPHRYYSMPLPRRRIPRQR